MKVRASVKPICDKCKVIKETGKLWLFAQKVLSTNKLRAKIKEIKIWQELQV